MRTTDYNLGKDIKELSKNILPETAINDLRLIANQKIRDIKLEEHPNLFIFPPKDYAYGDEIGEGTIFSLHDTTLTTNKIMGFVGVNNTRLTITSRFAEDDDNDYFLHYMLRQVLSINAVDLDQLKNKEPIWDFLPYLFPYYLKRAISQGIYRKYKVIKNNDLNIRGAVDIKRHLNLNTPFLGKVAYTNRIYSTDNEVTELIRHTIEELNSNRRMSPILKSDKDTIDAVHQIISVTKNYDKNDRNKVISKNLKSVSHPYFLKYRELQKLCRLILRHDKLTFGDDKDRIFGLLFDGAWLWEEYLGKILNDKFIHPQNKTKTHKNHLFQDENDKPVQEIYPDFISIKKPFIIADAKYKPLDNDENEKDYRRIDYYQILAYMFRFTSKSGYLLFPYPKNNGRSFYKEELTIKETNSRLTKLGLAIPQKSESFDIFAREIKKNEDDFINEIMEQI
jgi:5-methylcytosine-specific restriction endonuclease McrBC regulatory subunit McrC